MCGILVCPSRYSWDLYDNAMSAMGYRGDREEGNQATRSFAGWTIAHVRLAIQDRSPKGQQPFVSSSGIFGFVGEFFNHKGQISERDHLLSAFSNEQIFHQSDGFWAAANVTRNSLTVYTDHLGIKPMYYWPKHQIFCSEIEPMFQLEQKPELDRVYLSNCVKNGYDYSGRTPYQGIVQMAPGTKIEVTSDGTVHESTYWHWHLVNHSDTLRKLVMDAIQNRLIGERPVALLLSGGLDSSIIYYTLRLFGQEIEAFSVENGETEFLPEGVSVLPIPDISVLEAVGIMQAPIDLGSLIPQVQLSRAVKAAGYNVCMTGDGADEVFGGYRRAMEYDSQHSDVFCELPYYHLPRLDRVMMRETIELRSPYLSPAVVAAGLALPRDLRTQKQALKNAFTGVVPDRIINRTKHPLKTEAVKTGGITYRTELVQAFIERNRA